MALLAALIGALCAIAVPFLPVRVDAATLSWPQAGSTRAVEAPLIAYAPTTFDATVPCAAITGLGARGGLLAATAPAGAPDLDQYGFVARVVPATEEAPARFDAVLRNRALFELPVDALPPGCEFTVHAESTASTATLTGSEPVRLFGDLRPQLVGVFSDLATADGTRVTAELDTRFYSSPTPIKRVAIWTAALATLIALVALFGLDRLDGRGARRVLPQRWWTFSKVDGVVLGTLVLWHFIGSTTSDDGYQFGMGRAALASGYMANYFRYFGVPETPVGTPYYDLIGWMSQISVASPWMRLPALCAGIVMWLVISREVVPRFGVAVRRNRIALWTGALVFLTVWLPYNNGLRPEPYVALGVLLTWCSVERGIATRRLLPFAVAIVIATFSFTAGPHGIICVAALLAGLRSLVRIIAGRARALGGVLGWLPLTAPLAAAGTLVLTVAFCDQPLTAMLEMRRVHQLAGPDVKWYDEYLRYQYLFMGTVDGSVARRFGIFVMLAGLAVCLLTLLRKGGRIPTASVGPSQRIIGVTVGALLLMMTTPTKWTHHLGVFAGLAGVIAVLTAVSVGPRVMRAPRNRALFAAGVSFLLALVFSGPNGWWYVSAYSIPWWDKLPSVAGVGVNQVFLLATVALAALAAWWHVRAPGPGATHRVSRLGWRFAALPPLTIAAALLVVFEVLSFAKGAVAQYPAFSLARSNIDAVTGDRCGLAGHVLVETDPNAGMLAPLTGDAATTLAGTGTGFTPGGVADDLSADAEKGADAAIASSVDGSPGAETQTGTSGAAMPFGLDPATPVLGTDGTSEPASITTGWYRLPEGADRDGIVALTAAGRIRSVDADGIETPGQPLEIEYGVLDGDVARPAGRVTPIDIGPAPSWRNLRLPIDAIPSDVTLIRVVASDRDRDPKQWLAFTPPRVPRTRTLNEVVGTTQPVLLDWAVGLQFPCQRPFDHRDGIAEVPGYRILPDRVGAHDTTLWQNHDGGGPLGWTPMLLASSTLATYLDDDWDRDWGELQRFTRRAPDAAPAKPVSTERDRGGLWSPGHINVGW